MPGIGIGINLSQVTAGGVAESEAEETFFLLLRDGASRLLLRDGTSKLLLRTA